MRILWLNHRDPLHPEAGGAEVRIREVGKRLVKMGCDAKLICERMKPSDNITVILPTLGKDLHSLIETFFSFIENIIYLHENFPSLSIKLVIVCNGCKIDPTFLRSLIRSEINYFDVDVLMLSKNYGYAGAIYIARSLYKDADFYVISNDDIKIDQEDVLYRLIERIMRDASIAVVSPKVLNYYNRDRYDYAGAAGFYLDFTLTPFCKGRLFELLTRDIYHDINFNVTTPSGCFMVLRNIDETKIDPYLFLTFEEADIGIKTLFKGFKICCDCKASIYHKGLHSFGSLYNPTRMYYVFRNRLYLLLKYSSIKYVFRILPLVIILDFVSAVLSSLTRNRATILSWLMAYLTLIRSLKRIRVTRMAYKEYKASIDYLYKRGLLVRDLVIIRYALRSLYTKIRLKR
ncbi:MAG: hypothetical protein QXT67_08835 [Candidatus Bathyarchaeia archaeon]